jgi:hypothetical protein
MERYINYAIWWDLLISVVIGIIVYYLQDNYDLIFSIPKYDDLSNFNVSLITVGATLIGFLLAIITIIVTFKKGYDDNKAQPKKPGNDNEVPSKTVFDSTEPSENKFYGTEIYKKVVDVFVNASFEIGVVLGILLLLQFNVIELKIIWITLVDMCIFIMIIMSIIRSLYIFKLFLNVHVHEKPLPNYSQNKN